MLELFLCALVTILPDYLIRRYAQGRRFGQEINIFSVWYELRWGITLCLILTVCLITTIFYFHPSTKSATSVFRSVAVLPQISGRVAETFVELNQRVEKGQPLLRLDSSEQEADIETARRRITEIEASIVVARSRLAEADGRIIQAQGTLEQALDEYEARSEANLRNRGTFSEREVDRMRIRTETEQGALDAALASREATLSQIELQLPAEKASAEAALKEAQVELEKTLVVAGTDGIVQQFAVKPGDVINPMLRPAGVLVPDIERTRLLAGFGQIVAKVMKVGMIGEVTCISKPWEIVPVVVTDIQSVIASGQVRSSDTLLDVQHFAKPGSITVVMEPLFPGQLDDLPKGGSCIANGYTSNHEALQASDLGTLQRIGLHAVDAVGVVHSMILRIQALLLPVQTLVLGGH